MFRQEPVKWVVFTVLCMGLVIGALNSNIMRLLGKITPGRARVHGWVLAGSFVSGSWALGNFL